jgi:hypothetical protein
MAIPERDTVYTNDGTNRTVVTRESSSTGWFVGIIVALALLAIGYLVFSANSGPATPAGSSVEVNNTPAVTAPADTSTPAPMTEAPATGTETTPMAPATDTTTPAAPATDSMAPAAPATTTPAPATTTPAPVTP